MLNSISIILASGFGVGILSLKLFAGNPLFPARWTGSGLLGTFIGLGIVWLGFPLSGLRGFVCSLILTLLAFWSADRAEKIWEVKDDTRIICDEIVGFVWSVLFLPFHLVSLSQRYWVLMVAFILFRLFDVCKWPFAGVQKFKGGWGILLDDLLAGLFVNILLQISIRLFI